MSQPTNGTPPLRNPTPPTSPSVPCPLKRIPSSSNIPPSSPRYSDIGANTEVVLAMEALQKALPPIQAGTMYNAIETLRDPAVDRTNCGVGGKIVRTFVMLSKPDDGNIALRYKIKSVDSEQKAWKTVFPDAHNSDPFKKTFTVHVGKRHMDKNFECKVVKLTPNKEHVQARQAGDNAQIDLNGKGHHVRLEIGNSVAVDQTPRKKIRDKVVEVVAKLSKDEGEIALRCNKQDSTMKAWAVNVFPDESSSNPLLKIFTIRVDQQQPVFECKLVKLAPNKVDVLAWQEGRDNPRISLSGEGHQFKLEINSVVFKA